MGCLCLLNNYIYRYIQIKKLNSTLTIKNKKSGYPIGTRLEEVIRV